MLVKIGVVAAVAMLGGAAILLGPGASRQQTAAAAQSAVPSASAERLPARLLDCDLGRITNFDPSKDQKPADYRFEGHHALRLFLASAPVRKGPPPSALTAPDPVDPNTRIIADPDGLAGGTAGKPFFRVVDYWPERVEMATPIAEHASTLVVLDGFDAARGTVNLFTTAAADGMTFDRAHLYAGPCKVTLGAAAEQAGGS